MDVKRVAVRTIQVMLFICPKLIYWSIENNIENRPVAVST